MNNFDDMGMYHDPSLRLERTEIAQQGFNAVYRPFQHDIADTRQGFDLDGNFHTPGSGIVTDPFAEGRNIFYTNVQQQIEAEQYYPRDPIAQEDFMQSGIDNLYDRGVITDSEAASIFASWISKRRPDTKVIKVTKRIAKPFYE